MKKYIKSSYELREDSNVHDWYVTNFPDDDLGNRISDITFSDVYNGMKDAKDFYDLVGVYDSVIRERVFGALADIYNVDVNTIYDLWQAAGRWSRGELALHEFRQFVKDLNASTDKISSSVEDDDVFVVCEHCLAAIESREGHQATTKDIPESRLYEVDEYNEYSGETYPEVVGVCDWCEEEYPEDELVRIL